MVRAAVLFAASVLASGCSLEPGHKRNGERTFQCYTEEPVSHFTVQFREKSLTLLDNGIGAELHFVPSIWPRLDDRYTGDGYALSLDPEATLVSPDGKVQGPCQD